MAQNKGFTLLEMMVVVAISLSMMVLIVPIFHVVTKSVQSVERKLTLYESARNVLDIMDSEIHQCTVNERGGHFSLKRLAWQDLDSFTPPGLKAFSESRRQADSIQYLVRQPGGISGSAGKPLFPGSHAFPLVYPENTANQAAEAWKATLRSTLAYQTLGDGLEYESRPGRPMQLEDVSLIESSMIFVAVGSGWSRTKQADGYHVRLTDQTFDTAAPGKEIKLAPPFDQNTTNPNNVSRQRQRRIDGIYLMDLDIAYWCQANGRFEYLPDDSVVYFSRPPKAVRATITVCDRLKRGRVTLSRIIHIPVGLGSGQVEDARDDFLEDVVDDYKLFDRTKKLSVLEKAELGLPVPLNGP